MQCKERLEAYLKDNQVPYQTQQHSQAFSAQKIAESEHISGHKVAKVVIVLVDNRMVALVLPGTLRADLNKVRTILGANEVRLAEEREFAAHFPDCAVGAMPPFGNLYGLPVYVDKGLENEETIVFPLGSYTETLSLKYADFARLAQPRVVEIARTRVPM